MKELAAFVENLLRCFAWLNMTFKIFTQESINDIDLPSQSRFPVSGWELKGAVTIPIIGARELSQFQDNLACLDVITLEHLQRLVVFHLSITAVNR